MSSIRPETPIINLFEKLPIQMYHLRPIKGAKLTQATNFETIGLVVVEP